MGGAACVQERALPGRLATAVWSGTRNRGPRPMNSPRAESSGPDMHRGSGVDK